MTDSESDASNVFRLFSFQNVTTTVSAKGPNTNITNFSFRNPVTSTMYMSRNLERPRYAESAYDQRSMYYRRETSPMSIHSACDIRPRNIQQYPSMSSRQSVFNGRGGSPMSMRSIDSSASVSAADIAFAFKNVKFNKCDLKVIKDAYHKLMKQRIRKRIEKRRNMRLFLKGSRRRSGDDSGDHGSDSSVSSGDSRSIKTSYKENMSSSRSARMDLTDFRKASRDTNMVKEFSDNFRQNTFKNKFPVMSSSVNNTQHFNNTVMSNQINAMPTQKNRFRNGFLLPSQRFNRSVASSVIMENSERPCKSTGRNLVKNRYNQNNKSCPSGSEDEEIFSRTVREKSTFNIEPQRKRSLDSEDESGLPDRKKSRIASPTKNAVNNKRAVKNMNPSNNNVEMSNSFEFAKPSLPVRKSKQKVQEKLIAKSAQPLTDFIEPVLPSKIQENLPISHNLVSDQQEKSVENQSQLEQSETTQNSDISSRPSFIKRKLFTQKLDVAEKANSSSDGTSSPHGGVYSLQKEKNKARRLVTNQSCLNRDVQDDNNLLDLIHKIVPPDRMNLTNQTTINQTKNDVKNKNKKDDSDKWDVTSVISMCNDDDVSDTYTDEEIFEAENTIKDKDTNKNTDINSKAKPINKVVNKTLMPQNCKVVVKKLHTHETLQKQIVNQNFNLTHNNVTNNTIKNSGKTFWDTDFESDAECQTVLPRVHAMDNLKKANAALETAKQEFKKPIGYARNEISKKSLPNTEVPKNLNNSLMNNTVMNYTFNNTHKFNTSTLSVRSHRTSKTKKCCNDTAANEAKSYFDIHNKIQVDKEKGNTKEAADKKAEKVNSKAIVQNKNPIDITKSKSSTQKETKTDKARSTSQSKNSSKDKKSTIDKRVVTPIKDTKKSESKSKMEKSSSTRNKKPNPGQQNDNKPAVKNNVKKQKENTPLKNNPKTQSNNQKNKKDLQKTPKNKPKSKPDRQNSSTRSKKNNTVLQPTNSNLNNTVDPVQNTSIDSSGRPVRSCRTRSHSRLELSGLNNSSFENNKSLRSRVINLSSSIENITIKLKPRNKIINNKNISQINTRKSDVSFTLGSNKHTPLPKKNIVRSRADFFKGR